MSPVVGKGKQRRDGIKICIQHVSGIKSIWISLEVKFNETIFYEIVNQRLVDADVQIHTQQLVDNTADIAVDATLTRLDASYIVILTAHLPDRETRSRKYKISSFDEIDVAIKRLVGALIEDIPVEMTAERGAVFEREQEPITRVKSDSGWEVAVGAAWPLSNALGTRKTHYAFTVGYAWDVMRVLIELKTDFQVAFDEIDTGAITGTLGLSYIWLDFRRVSFYSGADVGFGYVYGDVGSQSGFVVAGDTGILLLRHSDINVDLRFRITALTEKLNGTVPVSGALTVGLRW